MALTTAAGILVLAAMATAPSAPAATGHRWTVDLRERFSDLGFRPKSQGRRGTCSVFAVCGLCEYEWARASGESIRLSEEFLNWAKHRVVPGRSDGGCFHDIIPGLQHYGVAAADAMPYHRDFVPELVPSPEAVGNAFMRRGVQVRWVKEIDSRKGFRDTEQKAAFAALESGHPVALGLTWFKGETCLGEDGLLDTEAAREGNGHSVILVGYRLAEDVPGGGAYLVRNHGGEGFGEAGYMQLPFAWTAKHANDAFYLEVPSPGSVVVRSKPPGAKASIDGVLTGVTPVTFGVIPAGPHRVRIGAPGRWCVEHTLAVRPGGTQLLTVSLRPGGPPAVGGPGATWIHAESGVTFVSVPVSGADPACLALEAPAPEGPFWIGRTEVSNAQFDAFIRATGYKPKGRWQVSPGSPYLPAANVTYDDAAEFCTWLGGRLPTEGEFEWAGRGPQLPPFPWGPVADLNRYVGGGTPTGGEAQPVGSLPTGASWCGALDIVGNVSEWCSPPFPGGKVARTALFWDDDEADRAVLRGGSYVHGGAACRPTWRYVSKRSGSGKLDGFRAAIPAVQ